MNFLEQEGAANIYLTMAVVGKKKKDLMKKESVKEGRLYCIQPTDSGKHTVKAIEEMGSTSGGY